MKNVLAVLIGFFCLAVLQTTFVPDFFSFLSSIIGIDFLKNRTVDFLFLGLMYFVVHRKGMDVILWAVVISLGAGSLGTAWAGALTASFFITAAIAFIVSRQVLLEGKGPIALFCTILTFVEGLIHLWMAKLLARIPEVFGGQFSELFFQSVLNGLLVFFVFGLFGFIDSLTQDSREQARSELMLDL